MNADCAELEAGCFCLVEDVSFDFASSFQNVFLKFSKYSSQEVFFPFFSGQRDFFVLEKSCTGPHTLSVRLARSFVAAFGVCVFVLVVGKNVWLIASHCLLAYDKQKKNLPFAVSQIFRKYAQISLHLIKLLSGKNLED